MKQAVYLSLGSNMGDRLVYLTEACKGIENFIGPIQKSSSIYETKSWGFETDNKFLNQVVLIETELSPTEILAQIRRIEEKSNRVRKTGEAYISRTLDIDILYYGTIIFYAEHLIIPHPRLEYRKFVLQPLAEVDPGFIHPVLLRSNLELLEDCADNLEVKKYQEQ